MPAGFEKDFQYYRFCLYGFLKNQKFYEPFFLLFLLSKDISYLSIGLLYSIKEIVVNLLEIPGGIIADSAGRKRTMIISFLFYISSFITFYVSNSYYMLVAAIVLFGIGDVFRTGTHKAMIYDYLSLKGWDGQRVDYYGHTRSWSQIGSAVSSLIAATIVIVSDNYSAIFLFAILPYLLNLANLAAYPQWLDGDQGKFEADRFRQKFREVAGSLISTFRKTLTMRLYVNSSIISGFYDSAKDYLQPLLVSFALALPLIKWVDEADRSSVTIGITYFIIYLLTSRASKLSGRFSGYTGGEGRGMNLSYLFVSIAGILSGLLFHLRIEAISIIFFVLILIFENLRRPVCVSKISSSTNREALSTYLSVDSQLKSLFTMIISPILGFVADKVSPGAAILMISAVILLLLPAVRIRS
ncbi:MAG TPA: MFS transporter [Bacteroidales bacterium]|nr:MFS transporter [Bacteroidales bacterium]